MNYEQIKGITVLGWEDPTLKILPTLACWEPIGT